MVAQEARLKALIDSVRLEIKKPRDPMPPLMRALLVLRGTTPVVIGYVGSSTFQGNNASANHKRVVNIFTGMVQRAFPNQISADETTVQTLAGATAARITQLGVHGINGGVGGTGTANYISDADVTKLNTLGVNVRIHFPTTNDRRNNIAPATSKVNVQGWITKLKAGQPGPSIDILLTSYESWDGTYTYAGSAYAAAMREIAADPQNNGTVFALDISDAYLPLGVPPTSKFGNDILDIVDADNLHQNDKGHAYMAEVLRIKLGVPVENTPVAILPVGGAVRTGEQVTESLVFTRSS